ncbi:MAG: hypothetical protein KDK53_12440 [Maritimibacter sp.]|nr:hypothetical protein [Maritimibacter sp.]
MTTYCFFPAHDVSTPQSANTVGRLSTYLPADPQLAAADICGTEVKPAGFMSLVVGFFIAAAMSTVWAIVSLFNTDSLVTLVVGLFALWFLAAAFECYGLRRGALVWLKTDHGEFCAAIARTRQEAEGIKATIDATLAKAKN